MQCLVKICSGSVKMFNSLVKAFNSPVSMFISLLKSASTLVPAFTKDSSSMLYVKNTGGYLMSPTTRVLPVRPQPSGPRHVGLPA